LHLLFFERALLFFIFFPLFIGKEPLFLPFFFDPGKKKEKKSRIRSSHRYLPVHPKRERNAGVFSVSGDMREERKKRGERQRAFSARFATFYFLTIKRRKKEKKGEKGEVHTNSVPSLRKKEKEKTLFTRAVPS